MQRNVNLNCLCRSYRNGISKMSLWFCLKAARILRMYILNLCVRFFTNKFFHLSDIFQQLAKSIANGNDSTDDSTDLQSIVTPYKLEAKPHQPHRGISAQVV